jgi:hypothetical protein
VAAHVVRRVAGNDPAQRNQRARDTGRAAAACSDRGRKRICETRTRIACTTHTGKGTTDNYLNVKRTARDQLVYSARNQSSPSPHTFTNTNGLGKRHRTALIFSIKKPLRKTAGKTRNPRRNSLSKPQSSDTLNQVRKEKSVPIVHPGT